MRISFGAQPMSGGSPVIATSSMVRSRMAQLLSCTRAHRTGPSPIGFGESSKSIGSTFFILPRPRSAHSSVGATIGSAKHDLSSLRLLGTVGEPINPEAWMWYYKTIGGGRCPIVDTWWQTETGSIMITPLPGATPTKPGSATLPFFGVDPAVVDAKGTGSRPEYRRQIDYSPAMAFDVAHDLRRQCALPTAILERI